MGRCIFTVNEPVLASLIGTAAFFLGRKCVGVSKRKRLSNFSFQPTVGLIPRSYICMYRRVLMFPACLCCMYVRTATPPGWDTLAQTVAQGAAMQLSQLVAVIVGIASIIAIARSLKFLASSAGQEAPGDNPPPPEQGVCSPFGTSKGFSGPEGPRGVVANSNTGTQAQGA